MRKFIRKTLVFILPLFFAAICMEVLLRHIPNNYTFKKEYLDTHSNEIETLILGSSHSYFGIDPVYLSSTTFNAGNISQSLNFDYEILKKYQSKLKKLTTVIIPISYFSLFGKLETGRESWRVKNYVIYCGMDTPHSLCDFSEIMSNRFNINIRRLISYYINKKSNITCTKLGWGAALKSDKSLDLIETGRVAATRHTEKNKSSLNDNIKTLKSIINLCKSNKINIIFFTPPAYKTYRQNLNAEQLETTTTTVNSIVDTCNFCQYINLLEETEFIAEDYFDADHLNEIGTKKLSLLINERLKTVIKGPLHSIAQQKRNIP